MAKRGRKKSKTIRIKLPLSLVIILVILFGIGYLGIYFGVIPNPFDKSSSSSNSTNRISLVPQDKETITFHFMELGNEYAGDSIYIKAGETDILIDAGSRTSSSETIIPYINQYCLDGKLEYVIATHADQDHIAAFVGNRTTNSDIKENFKGESITNNGIFYYYEVGTIIDFAQTDKSTQIYNNYKIAREYAVSKGATHYTAEQCRNKTSGADYVYTLGASMTMTILDSKYYYEKSSDENNYSVCTLFTQVTTSGERHFLLTGDLEKEGEEELVKRNSLPKVELYKGGHHGSKTSSNDVLLDVIQPKMCAVCCCAGSREYTPNVDNQFPTQDFINRIGKWTDKVFVTTLAINDASGETTGYTKMNGTIIVNSSKTGVTMNGLENDTLLKDTAWFNQEIYVNSNNAICSKDDKGAKNRPMRTWPSAK